MEKDNWLITGGGSAIVSIEVSWVANLSSIELGVTIVDGLDRDHWFNFVFRALLCLSVLSWATEPISSVIPHMKAYDWPNTWLLGPFTLLIIHHLLIPHRRKLKKYPIDYTVTGKQPSKASRMISNRNESTTSTVTFICPLADRSSELHYMSNGGTAIKMFKLEPPGFLSHFKTRCRRNGCSEWTSFCRLLTCFRLFPNGSWNCLRRLECWDSSCLSHLLQNEPTFALRNGFFTSNLPAKKPPCYSVLSQYLAKSQMFLTDRHRFLFRPQDGW